MRGEGKKEIKHQQQQQQKNHTLKAAQLHFGQLQVTEIIFLGVPLRLEEENGLQLVKLFINDKL